MQWKRLAWRRTIGYTALVKRGIDIAASGLLLLVLSPGVSGDLLAAQVTSQMHYRVQVPLCDNDFDLGQLPKASIVRPDKIFTLNQSLVIRRVG